jgi:hypothetical protein
MNKVDVVSHFGNTVKTADALKISQAAVSKWGEIIPEKQALRLGNMNIGSLKYRHEVYLKGKSRTTAK